MQNTLRRLRAQKLRACVPTKGVAVSLGQLLALCGGTDRGLVGAQRLLAGHRRPPVQCGWSALARTAAMTPGARARYWQPSLPVSALQCVQSCLLPVVNSQNAWSE